MGEQLVSETSREGNISLILDSYGDLFSDFDPRPYSEKALSEDFLEECNRAVRNREDGVELRLLVPKKLRNHVEEAKIKKRLKSHFHKHFEKQKKKFRSIRMQGIAWFLMGTFVMIGSTFLYPYHEVNFFLTLLSIVSEPASWFFFWEGLGKFFMESKRPLPKYNFYKRMSKLEIYFIDY
jgi:hypothetical protein